MMKTLAVFSLALLAPLSPEALGQTVYATSVPNVNNWVDEVLATGNPGNPSCSVGGVAAYTESGTNYLTATNFGNISVPAGQIVTSVVVGVSTRYNVGAQSSARIQALWNGTQSGANSPAVLNTSFAGSQENCTWREIDITGLESAWTQAELNSIQVRIKRVSPSPSNNRLRVKAFRIRYQTAVDCNGNGIDDAFELPSGDCNGSGVLDVCELSGATDCNFDGILDVCQLAGNDCNNNGRPDVCDLPGNDCDNDGVLDSCDGPDCNNDNVPDNCQIPQQDCNNNGVLDWCEAGDDCNGNDVPDLCEVLSGAAEDCNGDGILDECGGFTDCNFNDVPDSCEVALMDCDNNGVPDDCAFNDDCNFNQVPDTCEIAASPALDCDANGIIDSCELGFGGDDCNDNEVLDVCEISAQNDCNGNGVLDECDVQSSYNDCDGNGIPDVCELNSLTDCNSNQLLDSCEIASGEPDCNSDGVLDVCEPDCNNNGTADPCEVLVPLATTYFETVPLAGTVDIDVGEAEQVTAQDSHKIEVIMINEPQKGQAFPNPATPTIMRFTSSGIGCGPVVVTYRLVPIDSCQNTFGPSNVSDVTVDILGPQPVMVDCNDNCVDDAAEVLAGSVLDCDLNGIPDSCQDDEDCDNSGVIDICEVFDDCNLNGVPDACDPFSGEDCNMNGVPDECDVAIVDSDCNGNGVPDDCELTAGTLTDANQDGVPDQCDLELAGFSFCQGVSDAGPGCENCPCGNGFAQTLGGCRNAGGTSTVLIAFGAASGSQDTLNLYLQSATPNSFALLVSADNPLPNSGSCLGAGLISPVFDGKRCVGGNLFRHGSRATDGAGFAAAAWGPDGAPAAGLVAAGAFSTGQVRRFQSFYRDVGGGACGLSLNTSNAVEITMAP